MTCFCGVVVVTTNWEKRRTEKNTKIKERRRKSMVLRKVGKYEIGRTIGEGTFAKVKFAQNTETGESVAMKVLDRSAIFKHKMVDQVLHPLSFNCLNLFFLIFFFWCKSFV